MAARSASEGAVAPVSPGRYAALLTVLLSSCVTLVLGGLWPWTPPLLMFGLAPAVELLLPDVHEPPRAPAQAFARIWSLIPAAMAVWLVALLVTLLYVCARTAPPWATLAGMTVTVGMSLGGIGLNIAHELGHRPGRLPRAAALFLLTLMLYGHWRVEHTRGHHPRVGTAEDPASARRGEAVYGFALRSAWRGARSAWRLEAERLARTGRSPWSFANEVALAWTLQAVWAVTVAALCGPRALGVWLAACGVAILLTETVNYTQHYGLRRARGPDGRPVPVSAALSWCSDRPISRVVFLEMPRHADHHAHPARHFPELEHNADAPVMPLGLLGQIALALVPPLWFRVMDPRLDRLAV